MAIYRGVNGVNRQVKKQYRGINGVNREIKEQWRGFNGVNRPVMKKPYVVTNILINPSFEDTTERHEVTYSEGGFSRYSFNAVKYGQHSFFMYGTTGIGHFYGKYYKNPSNHILYTSCYVYVYYINGQERLVNNRVSIWLDNYGKDVNIVGYTNQWLKVSQRGRWSSSSPQGHHLILHYRTDDKGRPCHFDGAVAIDLTACFGAGNEPSKEWCDENIDYFTGSRTLYY